MYINSNYGEAITSDIVVMDTMIENMEHLLFKYRVNLGFYGHNHAVQRMSAVYDSVVEQAATTVTDADGNEIAWHENPQATVHMVIGTGGAKFTENFVEPYPAWCEKVFYQYGYARVIAVNESYLKWEWVDASDNIIYDQMVITQTTDFSEPWVLSSQPDDDAQTSGNGDSTSLSDVTIAFIVIGCMFFVFIAGLFAYRMIRSETEWFTSAEEKNGITMSAMHGDSENHLVKETEAEVPEEP